MSPSPAHVPTQPQKDRFLAFAFAAADLLIEVRPDGVITFAAGAFNARFGAPPDQFIGRHLRHLFAPADQPGIELALSVTGLRGRLPPLVLRLADTAATPVVVSALMLPNTPASGTPGLLCLTVGRLPALPGPSASTPPPALLARAAELQLRTEPGGGLGLLEIVNWQQLSAAMPTDVQLALQADVTDALARLGGQGTVAGTVAAGRFGVLTTQPSDLRAFGAELEQLLRGYPGAKVHAAGLPMDRGGLTVPQAARALRFALARYTEGGIAATDAAGFRDGLANFIAGAELRARTIRSTIAQARFRLAFQPVASLASRSVHHYEALLRPIFSPGSVIQTTQDFVTFAEAVGLAEELDWAVLQQAMAAVADAQPKVTVAVNMSGLSIQSAAFRDRALDALRRRPGSAGQLLVELTDTADIDDDASAMQTIAGLRENQVPVCLDHFGAGSATFRYLREFQMDFVKLDGAYVRGAATSAREHGLLLSMVELASFVGARVIAGTIETEQQATLMRDAGIELGQGWLFGRPGGLPGVRNAARLSA